MPINIGVIQFPGSNCEYDALRAVSDVFKLQSQLLWHEERLTDSSRYQCLILPGGFSYGDYLRCGAMARLSPVMQDVVAFAERGGLVLGICNGFQVLTEMKLLPGALLDNVSLKFACQDVWMRVENNDTPFTCAAQPGQVVRMPIAHGQGCYYIDPAGLAELERRGQILLRYCDAQGKSIDSANPNGSLASIAGICNAAKNVMGLMPHPERSCEEVLGGTDGRIIFESLIKALR